MKRFLSILLLVSSLHAMNEDNVQHSVTIDKGDGSSCYLAFDVLDEGTKVFIDTENELDQDMEHGYLDGLSTVYISLGYGALDLRRLEEQIAQKRGGKENSKFAHAWDSNHSTKQVPHEISISPVFIKSNAQIASPCPVSVLHNGATLRLLTNLEDRWKAILFASTMLKPSMVDEKPTVKLSILEEAVLAELEEETSAE